MIDLSSVKVNSIGSSIVTMCMRSRSLMYWSIEAIVVDLPEPVTPARRTIPWSYCVISAMMGGSPSPSKFGIEVFTRRATRLSLPRWRNRLTRNRVSMLFSRTICAKSIPPVSSRIWSCRGDRSGNISRSMSDSPRVGSCIWRSTPASRMAGASPTLRWRSEPLCFMTIRNSLLASGSFALVSTLVSVTVAIV